jgi:plastocyanin
MKKIAALLVVLVLGLLFANAIAIADDNPSGDAAVKIKGLAYKPATLTVAKGTKVEFTNSDSVTHTVSRNGGGFNDRLAPGEDFAVRFRQQGTFSYHCNIHPFMKGKIVVK